jgi:hypothetical protein
MPALSQSRHETFAWAIAEHATPEATDLPPRNGGPARESANTSANSRHFPPFPALL